MWLPLTLLVLAGTVSADFEHGWKQGNEYTYLVRSRTLTNLGTISDQHAGILLKATLRIQVKDPNTLVAKLEDFKQAGIHKSLSDGWDTEISDRMLDLQDMPVSGTTFEIKIKHGVIRDLIVEGGLPTWEVNMVKSIVSQLQVDSQGENVIKSKNTQVPSDSDPYGSFVVMEDSVAGKCEVLYDITPLPSHVINARPELVPKPELLTDGHHIDITKTKNFNNCLQRVNYHFGITGETNWEPGSNSNGNFLSKSSTSRIVISGTLKSFTIQSSVTTSKMFVSPRFYDSQNGMVVSRMNLTLANVKKISYQLSSPRVPSSTGNLVYIYHNPFLDTEERRVNKKFDALNSKENLLASDGVSSRSSSEEAKKTKQDLRSLASDASMSSSSISSSEENDFWQPKPVLEDALQNPLMPNFIGYDGKFIGKSDKVYITETVKQFVFEIANELEDQNSIPTQETLDKFLMLCSLIRTMNRKQISEVENELHISPNDMKSNDKTQIVKQNAWAVFRDAITQAGTGPAFLTIKNWIENRDIGNLEAADILSRLPKTARTPTDQYIKAFFELVKNKKVKNTEFLNTAVTMSFAELIRLSQVNGKSIHNRYPVHTFGRLTPKHDQAVQEEYIPFLARELKDAIRDGDNSRIQIYIMALGNIGHPKVLSIFEPFLEGKEQLTVFQRTLMVAALGKLTETNPKLARSVLYKLYLNTLENHEVRCTAVFLLMKTDPPLSMLQRMAQFTNFDTSKQVNSAVKSTIESLADMTSPDFKVLSQKARIAKDLLVDHEYSYHYSHGFLSETVNDKKNVITQMILNYIGSDDSLVPRALYIGWYSSYGDFKTPAVEFLGMLSSLNSLKSVLYDSKKDEQSVKMAAERIAEQLSIIPEEAIPLEGNLMWNTEYLSRFLPFDKKSVHQLHLMILKNIMAVTSGDYINVNKLMSYDVTLGFPTESGLPFVYTFRVPTLQKLSGTSQLQMGNGMMNLESSIRLTYSKKVQGRIGFVVPFLRKHFVAGVDSNFQVHVPMKLSLGVDLKKRNMQLKIWPLGGEQETKLLHYSVVPYISSHDILGLRPLLMDKNTQLLRDNLVTKNVIGEDDDMLRLVVEGVKSDEKLWDLDLGNLGKMFTSPWITNSGTYRAIRVLMNMDGVRDEPLIFTIAYDSLNMAPDANAAQQWTTTAKIVEPSSKEPNSEARRMQLLKEATKGIKLAKAEVVDIQLKTPGETKSTSVITVAWANSNVDSKIRSLIYWRFDMPSEEIGYEVCTATQSMTSPDSVLTYDQAIETRPKAEFDVGIRYGKTCSNGEQISIKGLGVQTSEMKKEIMGSKIAKTCQEQMKLGNKVLGACRNAAALAMLLDEMDIVMDIHSKDVRDLIDTGLEIIANSGYFSMDISKPRNAGKTKIDIKTKLSKDLQTADVSIHSPTVSIQADKMDLSEFGVTANDFLVAGDRDMDINNLIYNEDQPSCTLDRTRAETFDGKEYPLRLGNCWHVLMTTYPKMSAEKRDEKQRVPEDNNVSILGRETENGHKEVKILLGDKEIKLLPTSSKPQVIVNGQEVEVTKDMSYQEKKEGDVVFEIFKSGERVIRLVSEKHEVDVVFDGKRIMIKAAEDYRGSVRGLCGNFDGNSDNDFIAPKNCQLRKPHQFIASYALTKEQCEGESLENARSIQKNDCVPQMSSRQSNVISDTESGRTNTEFDNWGYHQGKRAKQQKCSGHKIEVVEAGDKICFSKRPVTYCTGGCSATSTRAKSYDFHCMERNQRAMNLKKRIEKNAVPDLSELPVSMTRDINVPVSCKA
uniref:Vitellogenin n=1 Tax=Centris tarsata TaxID=354140 RepID=A0A7T1IPX1_9HYME|nr:vitellogenin precursor [Centris tarsata]